MRPCPTAIGRRHCALPDGHSGDHIIRADVPWTDPYFEAEILAAAIEHWRDTRGNLDDPDDRTLYDAAVWYRTWRDHGGRGVYAQESHR